MIRKNTAKRGIAIRVNRLIRRSRVREDGITKRCIVLMPFSNPDGKNAADWDLFIEALSNEVRRVLPDYECDRFLIGAGSIPNELIRAIVASDIVICDLTYLKPNVLFELGISIVLGKPTILLIRGDVGASIPSDFSSHAYLRYEYTDRPAGSEQPYVLRFAEYCGLSMFERTLKEVARQSVSYTPYIDSSLVRIVRSVGDVLKHAARLEGGSRVLVPAIQSLVDDLIVDNAQRLGDFMEREQNSVTLRIDSPRVLFNVLTSVLGGLTAKDRYDSITWRQHWLGDNHAASSDFLRKIVDKGEDAPMMRRVFLVGVEDVDAEGKWVINATDAAAARNYMDLIRTQPRVENRALFLPSNLVEPVAQQCHMGRLTKGEVTLFVFSRYTPAGSLESFRLIRGGKVSWRFEKFWTAATEMGQFAWESPNLSNSTAFRHLRKIRGKIVCDRALYSVLKDAGVSASGL